MRIVTQRTGLGADLLRAWERRHAAITPGRSQGGQRLYSDADIGRLELLRRAVEHGHGIGQLAALADADLRALIDEPVSVAPRVSTAPDGGWKPGAIDTALRAIATLDDRGLEALLRRLVRRVGATEVVTGVIVPVMREVGERWHRRELTPAHEHLATGVVERTLHWMLDLPATAPDAPIIALATLAGERHELGIQVTAVLAASEGLRVLLLGADLPGPTIAAAVRETGAAVLGLSFVSAASVLAASPQLRELRSLVPEDVPVLVGGAGAFGAATTITEAGCVVTANIATLLAHLPRSWSIEDAPRGR